jgi:serine/threonine protein kinase
VSVNANMNALRPGQILGDTYRVEQLLGRGGMAEVYVVAHTRLPRRFALKLLRLDSRLRAAVAARFAREAEILGRLRHPHIIDVTDWNHTPAGEPYLVMELLIGEDLGRFARRHGPLPAAQALEITAQIGAALSAAHRVGVVHRDLKPSNIFLRSAGPLPRFVKVLDFGIARLVHQADKPLTAAEEVLGTPGYMAPEQARGKTGEADARADQFALAAILYELLVGKPAFHVAFEPVPTILDRVLHLEPPPLSPQLVPEPVERALFRALRKRPEERFPSIDAFLDALGTRPSSARDFQHPSAPPAPRGSRRFSALTEVTQRRILSAAVVATLAVLIAAWAVVVFLF